MSAIPRRPNHNARRRIPHRRGRPRSTDPRSHPHRWHRIERTDTRATDPRSTEQHRRQPTV